ncbi:MAG: 4-alpha-glucanotransferase [Candidatus Cloacimonetes bacterium HGW-Cloacimonetes-3]|jgi:4-alpha-glucanotransferase|nr:MAG: 4-alpha-glucanotransferase [Candidatus Cloacimonetes bacterium HGW-Cloacimonetes-3]
MRETGILLHITSLPTEFGIGDFGPAAYRFSEYLKREGHKYWQILPVNHCGYGNSPYNPISAFALSPYLISPELLYQQGLISARILEEAKLPPGDTVFYESVYKAKDKLLAIAGENWLLSNDISRFVASNKDTLKPYLAFQILSRIYGDNAWHAWNPEHRRYTDKLFDELWISHASAMKLVAAYQCILMEQIALFRAVLNRDGITLVGDVPLYLSYESADVWAHPELFDLDENGVRLHYAGVPPDAFASEGQLWGNPIYRWDTMKDSVYQLFLARISHALNYIDILRLDHFIGYVNFWQVESDFNPQGLPISPTSAKNGRWVSTSAKDFFALLCSHFGKGRFIAEDLGILNDEVCNIRDSFGFPGMIVLQFCFEESVPKVREYPASRWLYTGTHDNPTLRGWFEALLSDSPSLAHLMQYCSENKVRDCRKIPNAENIHQIMRSIALASACEKVIMPYQDVLGLDDSARMNVPGTALGNWQWRISMDTNELF